MYLRTYDTKQIVETGEILEILLSRLDGLTFHFVEIKSIYRQKILME